MILVRAYLATLLLASIFPALSVAQTWTTMTNRPPGDVGAIFLLRDGSVLAHNESNQGFVTEIWYRLKPVVTPDGRLDYLNGVWWTTGPMPAGYQPKFFSSAVLPDGRLLVEGGEYCGHPPICDSNLGAIYDPISEMWTPVMPPTGWSAIGDSPSVVLPSGVYMQADCCDPGDRTAQFDPTTLQWPDSWRGNGLASLGEAGWTLMTNDKVLMVEPWLHTQCPLSGYELYDPVADQWSCGSGHVPGQLYQSDTGEIGAAVMMYNGDVIQFGANDQMPATALYNVSTDSWTWGPTPPNNLIQTDGPAALEPNGNVLALMSPWTTRARSTYNQQFHLGPGPGACQAVEYVPSPGTGIGLVQALAQQPRMCSLNYSEIPGHLLVLPTGQVMLTYTSNVAEIFTPLQQQPWPDVAPQVSWISDNSSLSGGNTYSLLGYQLNGLSQANMFGDDYQAASNYPLIVLQDTNNPASLVFATTSNEFDPSDSPISRSNSIEPHHLTGTHFTVPGGSCSGNYKLTVITNGISSKPVPVSIANIQCTN